RSATFDSEALNRPAVMRWARARSIGAIASAAPLQIQSASAVVGPFASVETGSLRDTSGSIIAAGASSGTVRVGELSIPPSAVGPVAVVPSSAGIGTLSSLTSGLPGITFALGMRPAANSDRALAGGITAAETERGRVAVGFAALATEAGFVW